MIWQVLTGILPTVAIRMIVANQAAKIQSIMCKVIPNTNVCSDGVGSFPLHGIFLLQCGWVFHLGTVRGRGLLIMMCMKKLDRVGYDGPNHFSLRGSNRLPGRENHPGCASEGEFFYPQAEIRPTRGSNPRPVV